VDGALWERDCFLAGSSCFLADAIVEPVVEPDDLPVLPAFRNASSTRCVEVLAANPLTLLPKLERSPSSFPGMS